MCRLTVRAPEGVWQGEVDPWSVFVVLAALSAEPESFEELSEAVRRYQPEHRLFDQHRQAAEEDPAADGPWFLIDLAGRTAVAGNGCELPDPHGAYKADDDEDPGGFPIVWLDTPADWLFRQAGDGWQEEMAARVTARTAAGRRDVRAVLFGPPLLEHMAEGVLATSAEDAAAEDRRRERTRRIHADWLMTPRADLGGATPRAVLLADRVRIDSDRHHRANQWSRQGHAPPPLPEDSQTCRLGGFGTMEVVLYFDLVRALLAEAWEMAQREPQPAQRVLVEGLAEFRDRWLHEPQEGSDLLLTPAELIALERRRMPVASDGCPIDDDCPLCQAMAAGEFGPSFMWFDGHHLELEDEFAFSLCATREEWEREQEEYRRYSEEMDRKERERAASRGETGDPAAGSAWQTSFVDWDAVAGPDASPQQALLALGFPLAELSGCLQELSDGGDLLRALNRAYGALRASQDAVAMDSATQEVREVLEEIGRTFPSLVPRCADLQSRLDEVFRLPF
jgi:hypothetical protein